MRIIFPCLIALTVAALLATGCRKESEEAKLPPKADAVRAPAIPTDPTEAARLLSDVRLKLLGLNLLIYASEHEGRYPVQQGAMGIKSCLDGGYLGEYTPEAFLRPDDRAHAPGEATFFSDANTSFLYMAAEWLPTLSNRNKLPLVMEKPGVDTKRLLAVTGEGRVVEVKGNHPNVSAFVEAFIAQERLEGAAADACARLRQVASELDVTRESFKY